MLSHKNLHDVIRLTPIASIDILCIHKNNVLLGKRQNNPAKDTLFNPGSKIFKLETIPQAIRRVVKNEIGLSITDMKRFRFLTATDHIYHNNFLDDSFKTHYISLSYVIHLTDDEITLIQYDDQHDSLQWFDIKSTIQHPLLHPYCKQFLEQII